MWVKSAIDNWRILRETDKTLKKLLMAALFNDSV